MATTMSRTVTRARTREHSSNEINRFVLSASRISGADDDDDLLDRAHGRVRICTAHAYIGLNQACLAPDVGQRTPRRVTPVGRSLVLIDVLSSVMCCSTLRLWVHHSTTTAVKSDRLIVQDLRICGSLTHQGGSIAPTTGMSAARRNTHVLKRTWWPLRMNWQGY